MARGARAVSRGSQRPAHPETRNEGVGLALASPARGDERRGGREEDPYWLWPFENYATFCPYLVGSYDRVALELQRYMSLGFSTFILDIPPAEDELRHIGTVFERAQARMPIESAAARTRCRGRPVLAREHRPCDGVRTCAVRRARPPCQSARTAPDRTRCAAWRPGVPRSAEGPRRDREHARDAQGRRNLRACRHRLTGGPRREDRRCGRTEPACSRRRKRRRC